MAQLTIIVAMDAKRGIGIDNKLPWHLPEDLIRFKQLTTGHPIIMGRKTFESIGRPLPNRRNIVLTRQRDWHADGVEVGFALTEVVQLIGDTESFVIGGAEIYTQALPFCSKLLITEIHADVHCDAFFPAVDTTAWKETERVTHYSEKNDFDYSFVTYQKI